MGREVTAGARQLLAESVETKQRLLADESLLEVVDEVANAIIRAYQAGRKVRFCGNGGSAADAQHLAAELSGRCTLDRDGLDAEALHVNTSFLTAVANDYGYEHVFSRLVQASFHPGDVLIAISTSGQSKNVIAAMERARSIGALVVAMTGDSGGRMTECCDLLLKIPSSSTHHIQECHITLGHIICRLVEERLFGAHRHSST